MLFISHLPTKSFILRPRRSTTSTSINMPKQNKQKQKMSGYYQPEEVMVEILYKLPVKTLVRCRAVCKAWNSLIKSPNFINTHLTKRNKDCKYLLMGLDRDYELLMEDNQQLEPHKQFSFPRVGFLVRGSCNGLICIWHPYALNILILCNPLVDKILTLPHPLLPSRSDPDSIVHGFGHDSLTNDHMLPKISRCRYRFDLLEAELYSLNMDSWKKITSFPPTLVRISPGPMVFLDGFLHCCVSRRVNEGNGDCTVVLRFDLGREEFSEIMLPEPLRSANPCRLRIYSYKDSSICVSDGKSIWLMMEYGVSTSWISLCTVTDRLWLFAFGKIGNLLFGNYSSSFYSCSLFSWDPERNLTKEVLALGEIDITRYYVSDCDESLLLLDVGKSLYEERAGGRYRFRVGRTSNTHSCL